MPPRGPPKANGKVPRETEGRSENSEELLPEGGPKVSGERAFDHRRIGRSTAGSGHHLLWHTKSGWYYVCASSVLSLSTCELN